ncbi:MAG: CoA pyrophosphatase [Woeseiaceae bacterium]
MPDTLKSISADEIRRRLAGTRMPDDPLAVDVTEMQNRLPDRAVRELSANLKAAAVLIPIIERGGGLAVLLTERSAALKHHAGQVSFPGGGMETHDQDISRTALREAHEEVGINAEEVEIAGFLHPTLTITGFAVTPVIGFVSSEYSLQVDPGEVESAFETPLDFLMDSRNAIHSEREFRGTTFPVTTFHYGRHRIWGATAGMILAMRRLLIDSENN